MQLTINKNKFLVGFVTMFSCSVVACGDGGDWDAIGSGDSIESNINALVVTTKDGNYSGGINEWATVTKFDGEQDLINYDMVVMEGSNLNSQLNDTRDSVWKNALYQGVPVYISNATEADKKSIGKSIGTYTSGSSLGYFVDVTWDGDGVANYEIFDLSMDKTITKSGHKTVKFDQETGALSAEEPSKDLLPMPLALRDLQSAVFEPTDPKVRIKHFNNKIKEYLMKKNEQLVTASSVPLDEVYGATAAAGGEDGAIPEGLIFKNFTLHSDGIKNVEGNQDASYSLTYKFSAFANNAGGENFKYVLLQQTGISSPGTMVSNSTTNRGWYQTKFYTQVIPRDEGMLYEQSSPETQNNVTQVTDSTSFEVGFKLKKDEPAEGSYKIEHSESRDISDWRVDQLSDKYSMAWEYRMSKPYDASTSDGWGKAIDRWMGKIKAMPPLSTSTLNIHTQSLWRTQGDHDGWISFGPIVSQTLERVKCNVGFLGLCFQAQWSFKKNDYYPEPLFIDLGAVK